jgi:hypothetical protein
VYLDNSCNPLTEAPDGEAECSIDMEYLSSPISLIWESGYDAESELSFTEFPLEPGKPNRTYVWKASENAPLLVYDPLHRGEITSATQLFGDWTFGGKQFASLAIGSEAAGTKWENGYEPLKTLDRNKDGMLSGAELEPLGLWFDRNRDGVSQQGEVKTVAETGVTKIFVSPDRRDELSGAVHAKLGYERTVDGKTVTGASVDWYGRSGESSAALANTLTSLAQSCSGK